MRARAASFRPTIFGLILVVAWAGCGPPEDGPDEASDAAALALSPWDEVLAAARGTDVTWRLWRGDPAINAYVDDWVAPRVEERFGIRLSTVEGQGPQLVNQLALERDAGARGGHPGRSRARYTCRRRR